MYLCVYISFENVKKIMTNMYNRMCSSASCPWTLFSFLIVAHRSAVAASKRHIVTDNILDTLFGRVF